MNVMKKVFSPMFPQMQDDGLITDIELGAENKIDVIIYEYPNAKPADSIFCYFDGAEVGYWLIKDDNQNTFPIIFGINAAGYPDGIYPSFLNVIDKAGNSSLSDSSFAIIKRNGAAGLPAPSFEDAENNIITRESIITNGGTDIYIPTYPGIESGDSITIIFYMVSENGDFLVESYYNATHILASEEVEKGFLELIPERYLLIVNEAQVYCFYIVKKDNVEFGTSSTARANLFLSENLLLSPPTFNDGIDGVLSNQDITDGVWVTISYEDMNIGDELKSRLRGFDVNNQTVADAEEEYNFTITNSEVVAESVVFNFSKAVPELVISGSLNCDYEVVRNSVTNISEVASVKLEIEEPPLLPAPEFTDAINGILLTSLVVENNGTPLTVKYETIEAGDNLKIVIVGYDKDNQIVPESAYIKEMEVTLEESSSGVINITIPKYNILSVEDDGRIQAEYVVLPVGETSEISSLKSEVTMKDDYIPEDGLAVILTVDAPPTDINTIDQTPFNRGLIFGRPGEHVSVTCAPEVTINESGSNTYELNLNEEGEGEFKLSVEEDGAFAVTIYDVASPGDLVQAVAIFKNYKQGSGDFLAYASTSGAYINNKMPCSIYVVTQPTNRQRADITKVRVTIQNSLTASIVGYPGETSADILLKDDHSAEIDIVNSVAESVSLLLTLPESSGSSVNIEMTFSEQRILMSGGKNNE
jgi:hypothetical protein